MQAATLAAALGAALIAGTFFAFSSFIMAALTRLPAPQGITAMQQINITVINPVFMGVFLGTAALCAAVAVWSLMTFGSEGAKPRLAGALLYLVGAFLLTLFANVPLNNALAAADPASGTGAELWQRYLRDWTMWNHVRGMASLAACGLLFSAWNN
ncbi:MAG: DUF1772 domain-containing protein [Aestuariivirga sp.]